MSKLQVQGDDDAADGLVLRGAMEQGGLGEWKQVSRNTVRPRCEARDKTIEEGGNANYEMGDKSPRKRSR